MLLRGNILRLESLNDAFDYYRDHCEKSVHLIKTAPPAKTSPARQTP